jgi:hypothetical protein
MWRKNTAAATITGQKWDLAPEDKRKIRQGTKRKAI